MANTNQINDAHELQANANKEGLTRYQEESIAKGESRDFRKDLIAELSNPFALSQEQGEQFAKNDSIVSDAVGGGGIDSNQNLATINSEINLIKAKISSIESKGDLTIEDKREKYALNKKLNELEASRRAELIKTKQENREEVIKTEDKKTEEVIKNKQDNREEVIKNKQEERRKIQEAADIEFARKQKIINQGIKNLQSRFK